MLYDHCGVCKPLFAAFVRRGQCRHFKSKLLRLSVPCYVCVCPLTDVFHWISVSRTLIPLCSLYICHCLSLFLRMALPPFTLRSLCCRATDYSQCGSNATGHMAVAWLADVQTFINIKNVFFYFDWDKKKLESVQQSIFCFTWFVLSLLDSWD